MYPLRTTLSACYRIPPRLTETRLPPGPISCVILTTTDGTGGKAENPKKKYPWLELTVSIRLHNKNTNLAPTGTADRPVHCPCWSFFVYFTTDYSRSRVLFGSFREWCTVLAHAVFYFRGNKQSNPLPTTILAVVNRGKNKKNHPPTDPQGNHSTAL